MTLDYSGLPFVVEPMQEGDIEQVMAIEHEAFSLPWSASAYRHELRHNRMAYYVVVRKQHEPAAASSGRPNRRAAWRALLGAPAPPAPALPPILGYGGFWLMVGEAHISTIATERAWRGKHLGELLLVAMIEQAQELGAEVVTLEVRAGNLVAQSLYRKYGFRQAGRRRHYYSDNDEDALIMTTDPLYGAEFQQRFTALKKRLWERLRAPDRRRMTGDERRRTDDD